jgi:amino acid transporter
MLQAVPAIIVGSVMFTFISFWRVAAVVLCDLASTAFYIGGIVEQAIGPAAPWFILFVMFFSCTVGTVYIESCALFVRGGVYRVVKQAQGGFPAKMAVSALLFDYILTGPISSVTAGQYLIGWVLEFIALFWPGLAITDEAVRLGIKSYGSVVIACGITLYFFYKNLIGIHESSAKALRIMQFTTAVAVTVLIWSGLTLWYRGPTNDVPHVPDLRVKVEYEVVEAEDRVTGEVREMWKRDPQSKQLVEARDAQGNPVPKLNPITGHPFDPLGFLPAVAPSIADGLREWHGWLSLLGVLGILIAFGQSVLAMSGLETLAQVYREVESPKLPNFKKAAVVIFSYAFLLTGGVSFLAVLIIPDEVRMKVYADNLLSGLSMYVIGPPTARLALNAIVVLAGFLILSGAVNTSIIGSNGVLNRVAEDGVLPETLQKPHPRYGTTYRVLYLIVGLQLFTIIVTQGNVLLLGEAYAFGVIWSFLFNALSMVVLRFKDRSPREFLVPFNIRIGNVYVPIGLSVIFLILASSAVLNFLTKEVATVSGLIFSSAFLVMFWASEHYHTRKRHGTKHEHLEQFTEETAEQVTIHALDLDKPFRKLVAIRSPQTLHMLQKALDETDPDTTEVVVMTAKTIPQENLAPAERDLDQYDRKLMTAVIELAEKSGKEIKPLIVPTNNPWFAVINTARSLNVQELIVGASNKFTAEEQLDQLAFYWINLHEGRAAPLTIRVLSKTWDVHSDIGGGCRIPKINESQARTVSQLRAAGVGVDRALLVHDGTSRSSDVFESVLTMLDPDVALALAHRPAHEEEGETSLHTGISLTFDRERAAKLGREIEVYEIQGDPGAEILRLVQEHKYDVVILNPIGDAEQSTSGGSEQPNWRAFLREHATCPVCEVTLPSIPREVDKS